MFMSSYTTDGKCNQANQLLAVQLRSPALDHAVFPQSFKHTLHTRRTAMWRGGIGMGVVTVTIATDTLPTYNNTITAQGGGSFAVAFSGIPGRTYTIQYSESLSPANWQFLGTGTANAIGFFQIIDTPPGAMRFYRTVYP